MTEDELRKLAHQIISGLEQGMRIARAGCTILISIPPPIFALSGVADVIAKSAEMQAAARVLVEAMEAVNAAAAESEKGDAS